MGTFRNVCPSAFRAILAVKKQVPQICMLSSSLDVQTVVNQKPRTHIAESVFKNQPVAVNKNVEMAAAPLTDTFGRHHTYLRISLTERCNLRFFQNSAPSQWTMDSNRTVSRLSALGSKASLQQITQIRFCHLTHIDKDGKANMVDVSKKETSNREATAKAVVDVGPEIANLINANNMSKGDVLSISQIAGIMGAKKTSELIPLCHNIFLSSVKVTATLSRAEHLVIITATVRCSGKTGVEMEALTAVSIAALTVYDMCKAISHDIVIKDVRLWEKSGGKRYFKHEV